jgi:virginiamycin B lyase
MPRHVFGMIFAVAVLLGTAVSARAQVINEYPAPPGGVPVNIITGPDQNLWFTDQSIDSVVQMTTTGSYVAFPIPTQGSTPSGIASGPDGNLWFAEANGNNIGRLTLNGDFTEFPLLTPGADPTNITVGSDGNIWFVEEFANNIGRITTDGVVTEFPLPTADALPVAITAGPDGNIWFSEEDANQIGTITPDGTITEFPSTKGTNAHGIVSGFDGNIWYLAGGATNKVIQFSTQGVVLNSFPIPTPSSDPVHTRRGPDGALYFSENAVSQIGRVTMAGDITEYPTPTANAGPLGITPGPDGAVWFVEQNSNAIGQLFPVSGGPELVSAILPGSQSVTLPTSATAFATVINAGTTTGTSCAIDAVGGPAEILSYQTANAENQLVGTPNTPIDIAPGAVQSFVITLTPTAAFSPETIDFGFYCANADSAAVETGVNTFIMSASSTPVPNIIALALTPTGDGIIDLPGPTGANAFAVATSDLGAGGVITVAPQIGVAALAVALSICETDPSSGQCLAAPAASVTTTIDTDATPTFAVFVQGQDTINFYPATNRIDVVFSDADGNNRGETSVAVRTQ